MKYKKKSLAILEVKTYGNKVETRTYCNCWLHPSIKLRKRKRRKGDFRSTTGRKNLREARYEDVVVVCGNGSKGQPEETPYDKVGVTAACPEIP